MSKNYRSGFERAARMWPDTNERYKNTLRAVRGSFNGFTKQDGYDSARPENLTAAQRRQIRRYYNLLTTYTEGGPTYKMPPSKLPAAIKKGGRHNVEQVMRAAQMPQGRRRAKYIFIKYDGKNIPKVGIKNGAPIFINSAFGYAKEFIELNPISLATDPIGTILSVAPLVEDARYFRIGNERHEFYNTTSLKILARKIIELQGRYDTGAHDWRLWLTGIIAIYSADRTPSEIINYERAYKDEFRARVKREQAKLRQQRKKA